MANLGAEEFTERVVSTLRKIEDGLFDNVTLRHPTLDLLRGEEKSETGRAMVVPLELGLNDSTTLTDDSGTFSTSVSNDIIGAAEYQWSDPIVSSVRLRWKELQMNQGAQAQINLIKKHIRNMEYSHSKALVDWLHRMADDKDAGQFHTFDEIVSDADYDTANGIELGGIDSSAQDLWQAQRIEIAQDSGTSIRKAFRTVENEIMVNTSNKNSVNAIVAGRDVFEEFVDSFDDNVRYTEFGEGQAKFREVKFGDIAVRLDPDCPADRAYFLDTSSWHFRSLAGNFMKTQEAQKIPGTLDYVTPVASVLAVGVNERRANAVLLRPETAS